MNANNILDVGIIQIVSITLLTFIIVVLLRQSKALKFERRIGPFSLDPITQEASFFAKGFSLFWITMINILHLMKKILKVLWIIFP